MPVLSRRSRRALTQQLHELQHDDQGRQRRNRARRIILWTVVVLWVVVTLIAILLGAFPERHTPFKWSQLAALGGWAIVTLAGGWVCANWLAAEDEPVKLRLLRVALRPSRAHQAPPPQTRQLRRLRQIQQTRRGR